MGRGADPGASGRECLLTGRNVS